jgi:endoglucanase
MLARLAAGPQVVAAVLVALVSPSAGRADEPQRTLDAAEYCRRLGRGVNLGNGLEAPREGAWGFTIQESYLATIKAAGFDSVRVPVRWSAHAAGEAPFTIDAPFLRRVSEVVDQARRAGLVVVVNVHHYDEIFKEPDAHEARLVALWRQIATQFRDRDDGVYFELLNEPHGALTNPRWNAMLARLLAAVRETNPIRPVVVGPGGWNNFRHLEKLELPQADRRLIATFHYYEPFEFTHQGASWVAGSGRWKGRTWRATADEVAQVRKDFDLVAAWSKKHERPVYLGEFGAYSAADMPSRALWTETVVHEARARGFSFAYWEFGSGFGAYDVRAKTWREPLLAALLAR